MPNTFTVTIGEEPALVYRMSHALFTVDYRGEKFLMAIDYKEQRVYASVPVPEIEEIAGEVLGEMLKRKD